jgi:hypothetical protein
MVKPPKWSVILLLVEQDSQLKRLISLKPSPFSVAK